MSYDRISGAVTRTLGDLGAQDPDTAHETFHFVLNNTVTKDNRIPPYGFSYDEARKRNTLPVPATQYGGAGPGGTFQYWDTLNLNPPTGDPWEARRAAGRLRVASPDESSAVGGSVDLLEAIRLLRLLLSGAG